jgi:hypothetical protein
MDPWLVVGLSRVIDGITGQTKHPSNFPSAHGMFELGCDFVSSHTNTQIRIRRFSIVQRFFHLRNRLLCVFAVKKPVLLVNTQILIRVVLQRAGAACARPLKGAPPPKNVRPLILEYVDREKIRIFLCYQPANR